MKRKQKGFTLMELIVVIAIIAVLMLILVPTMGGFVDQAKQEANLANAKAAYTAAAAQLTAYKSGLDPNPSTTANEYAMTLDSNNKMSCSSLHGDFYDASYDSSKISCEVEFNTTGSGNDFKITSVKSATYEGVEYSN